MSNQPNTDNIRKLCNIVARIKPDLSFTLFEIGAMPLDGETEPFHQLIEHFPQSQVIAFEVDEELCRQLNVKSPDKIRFFPIALGRKEGECDFFETAHPMCCSLYRPNEKLLKRFNNLEVVKLKSVGRLRTTTLDAFVHEQSISAVDFIKIDIQGAELDVFMGGQHTLSDTIFIVSEVEFIPLYSDQPLFGDVCRYLDEHGFMFHKFLGIAGRTLKPIIMNNNPNYASQHMWSDAVFIRDVTTPDTIEPEKLLKMGILAYIYQSPDVAFFCFQEYDKRHMTDIHQEFIGI